MCFNNYNNNVARNTNVKRLVLEEKKFIYNMLSEYDKDFNKCYICNKELNEKNATLVNLPTKAKTLCLCRKCANNFKVRKSKNLKLFLSRDDIKNFRNGEIKLIPFFNDVFIKLSFAQELWLDLEREKYGKRNKRNKSK